MSKNFSDEGYQLMGAAFEVCNEMGSGLLEEIYQECLEYELDIRNIPYQSHLELTVYYKDKRLQERYIPDLIATNIELTYRKRFGSLRCL